MWETTSTLSYSTTHFTFFLRSPHNALCCTAEMGGVGNDGDGNHNIDGSKITPQGFPFPTSLFQPNLPTTHQVGSFAQPQLLSLDSMLSATRTADPSPTDAGKTFSSNGSSSTLAGEGHSKFHRRSVSEIPIGYGHSSPMTSLDITPSLTLWPPVGFWGSSSSSAKKSFDFAKQIEDPAKRDVDWARHHQVSGEVVGERKSEGGDDSEDLFNAYLNFSGFDISSNARQRSTDVEREGNGVRINRSDSNESEVESCANEIGSSTLQTMHRVGQYPSMEVKVDVKMGGALNEPLPIGGIVPPRHGRSLSMDSFMSKLNFGSKAQTPSTQKGNSHVFSLEFGNGEFTPAEMEKIVANEKLAEIALSDPKRVKRILANRLSAARSKERKMRYISELEHKVQNLQSETTTLSAQVTLLQRDSTGLTNQNNELKFRLQAMEQQAQLKDALNEALNAEVQRLKLAAAHLGEVHSSSGTSDKPTLNTLSTKLLQHQQQQQLQLNKPASRSVEEEN